jgi:hypothetical protein
MNDAMSVETKVEVFGLAGGMLSSTSGSAGVLGLAGGVLSSTSGSAGVLGLAGGVLSSTFGSAGVLGLASGVLSSTSGSACMLGLAGGVLSSTSGSACMLGLAGGVLSSTSGSACISFSFSFVFFVSSAVALVATALVATALVAAACDTAARDATSTEVLATLALAPTSGDGASGGNPPKKTGQAVGLPEGQVAADCQQLSGTAEHELAAMPTTTEVLATLALAPTSGDGASRGPPPRKGGQAALFDNLPEGPAAADCQQPGGTAEHEPATMHLHDPFLLSAPQDGRILPLHARSMVPSAKNCAALL